MTDITEKYQVSYFIPYEGHEVRYFNTLEEIKEYLKRKTYEDISDADVIEVGKQYDVLTLLRDTGKGAKV